MMEINCVKIEAALTVIIISNRKFNPVQSDIFSAVLRQFRKLRATSKH